MSIHRLRRAVLGALALLTTLLALPAAANAAKVTSLQPWKASNRYLVTAAMDGRTKPQLEPRAKVDHVKTGQWVRISCQVTGQTAYGSRVWVKVNGLFVPDRYIKTYSSGFLAGAPTCKLQKPKPVTPKHPSRATLAKAVKAVAYERVYGSLWRINAEDYPQTTRKPTIIWEKNGCSVPGKLVEVEIGFGPWLRGKPVSYYSKLFTKSCDRHDFGYRNYGSDADGGMKLDPTASRRKSIDARFKKNLHHQCNEIFDRRVLEAAQRITCRKAGDAFYLAVSKRGASHFF